MISLMLQITLSLNTLFKYGKAWNEANKKVYSNTIVVIINPHWLIIVTCDLHPVRYCHSLK